MTNERAIEILNPEHREHYKSIETVNEACRMGMKALEYRTPKRPKYNNEANIYYCPVCERKVRINYDLFCSGCGQAIDWSGD